MRVMGLLQ
jgi:hypothetical protein